MAKMRTLVDSVPQMNAEQPQPPSTPPVPPVEQAAPTPQQAAPATPTMNPAAWPNQPPPPAQQAWTPPQQAAPPVQQWQPPQHAAPQWAQPRQAAPMQPASRQPPVGGSLAKQPVNAVALLAKYAASPVIMAEVKELGATFTYVGFCHQLSTDYPALAAKFGRAAVEPQPYLKFVNGDMELLNPLSFMLVDAFRYYAECDPKTGNVIRGQVANPGKRSDLWEQICAACLVFHRGTVIPAKIEFRRTKCALANQLIQTLPHVVNPDWLNQTDAHRPVANIPWPFARIIATASWHQEPSRTSGYNYFEYDGQPRPVTFDEANAVVMFLNSPEGQEQFGELMDVWQERVDEIKPQLDEHRTQPRQVQQHAPPPRQPTPQQAQFVQGQPTGPNDKIPW